MRRNQLILLIGLLVIVAGGAGAFYWRSSSHNEPKAVIVPLKDVPEAFLKKAKTALPDLNFDHAQRLPNGKYEIRGKLKSGKVREVELTSTGELVEVE
jgi:hypothetical protein